MRLPVNGMDLMEIGEGILAGIGGLALLRGMYRVSKSRKKKLNNIGRIFMRGEIMSHSPHLISTEKTRGITPESVEEIVKKALDDKVKGIIFDIDSPGGCVVPSEEIAGYIKGIKIPTVALIKDVGASGAYWVASACNFIVANKYSMVGSIGVILPHVEISRLAEKHGISYDGIQSGKYKDMGNMFRSFTKEERKILQEELNEAHEGFIHAIAENRKLDAKKVRSLANGLTYHGSKALKLGLIDAIGGIDEAVDIIEKAGNFEYDDIIDYKPKERGLISLLSGIGAEAHSIGSYMAKGFLETISQKNKMNLK